MMHNWSSARVLLLCRVPSCSFAHRKKMPELESSYGQRPPQGGYNRDDPTMSYISTMQDVASTTKQDAFYLTSRSTVLARPAVILSHCCRTPPSGCARCTPSRTRADGGPAKSHLVDLACNRYDGGLQPSICSQSAAASPWIFAPLFWRLHRSQQQPWVRRHRDVPPTLPWLRIV
jgi:hypothetical protein